MATPRRSSEVTKQLILETARDLFAERGIKAVSVRDIAAAAGVTHALVHRYFGTKEAMVEGIIRREVKAAGLMALPANGSQDDELEGLRRVIAYYLTEGQTAIKLFMRAELSGLQPEKLIGDTPRPLNILADWIAVRQPAKPGAALTSTDPALVSAIIGAAIFSLVTMAPWLMTSVGLDAEDYEVRKQEMVDILVGIAALAAGIEASS